MAVSTFQLFALAVLAVTLRDDLDITRSQIGILGAGNTATGALIAPTLGNLTDRIGAKNSVVILCLMSGAGMFVTAAAPTFWVILAGSVVAGLPQGWANSATNKLIAERLPPGERGVITGLKQSGVQFAIFLAGITLPVGASAIGWRWAVGLYGFVSLGVAALAALTLGDDRPVRIAAETRISAASAPTSRRRWSSNGDDSSEPVRLPGFVFRVALYALFLGLAAGGISRFIPLFANEELGFSEARAGAVVALGGLLGMIARVLWGQAADHRVDPRFALFLLACGSAATATLLFFATAIGGWSLWVVAIGMAFFLGAWNVVAMLAVITSVEPHQAGKATGTVMVGFLGGLTISAPLVGWSVDRTGDYQSAWAVIIGLAVLGILTMIQRPGATDAEMSVPSTADGTLAPSARPAPDRRS